MSASSAHAISPNREHSPLLDSHTATCGASHRVLVGAEPHWLSTTTTTTTTPETPIPSVTIQLAITVASLRGCGILITDSRDLDRLLSTLSDCSLAAALSDRDTCFVRICCGTLANMTETKMQLVDCKYTQHPILLLTWARLQF